MGDGDSGYKWCKKCKRWGCECFALPEVICEQCGKVESACQCDEPKPESRLLTQDEMCKAIVNTSSPPHEAIAKAQLAKDIKWIKTQHLQVIGVEYEQNCFVIPVSEVMELEKEAQK